MSERSFVIRTPPDDGLTAVHEALGEIWAESPGVGSWDRMAFETALSELTSNVVQHARSTRHVICLVEISVDDRELRAVLNDSASAPDLDVTAPRDMPDEWAEAGRGIPFIQALVTRFEYNRVDGQNIWSIVRERRRS
ncbi:serine/threonine-protein kinase RsbW [Rathayibacter oskolensis]|uniref:Serine/threonine-protein kinase RsbW n=1 Tax=Rathayibacter oskolensis TaxID=1891671 RepID=A0A1X7NEN1_9MICO|nr:ATP-binding protein [Rathayibacter oskolensis]SMH36203.1 serine/threonine-protein kinase RsbW [Rathayibacter oskolensis]